MALEYSFRVTLRSSGSDVVPFAFFCVFCPIYVKAGININPPIIIHKHHSQARGFTVCRNGAHAVWMDGWHSLRTWLHCCYAVSRAKLFELHLLTFSWMNGVWFDHSDDHQKTRSILMLWCATHHYSPYEVASCASYLLLGELHIVVGYIYCSNCLWKSNGVT